MGTLDGFVTIFAENTCLHNQQCSNIDEEQVVHQKKLEMPIYFYFGKNYFTSKKW